jgi:hypothetical protein
MMLIAAPAIMQDHLGDRHDEDDDDDDARRGSAAP